MVLQLPDNKLSEKIPSELGLLHQLSKLDLSFNEFTGSIPSELGQLTNIDELGLQANRLTGTMPTELGQLMNVGECLQSQTDPRCHTQRLRLAIFLFFRNNLSGFIPAEVCNLWNTSNLLEFGCYLAAPGHPSAICTNFYGGLQCPNMACCPEFFDPDGT